MKKKKIVIEFIEVVELELQKIRKQQKEMKDRYKSSPGAMQSASDTSRSELEWEINRNFEFLEKYEKLNENLKNISEKNQKCEKVCNRALVKIEKDNKSNWYLIVDKGGGMQLKASGSDSIYAVPTDAPMIKNIMGLKEGEQAEFLGNSMIILKVM